jgi:hypothetical protein
MTGKEFEQLLLTKAETLTCEQCQQEYGTIPEINGVVMPERASLLKKPGFIYYKDKIHCVQCWQCEKYVQKDTMYHPLADAPICESCYQSYKDSESCYIFEEDLAD